MVFENLKLSLSAFSSLGNSNPSKSSGFVTKDLCTPTLIKKL